MRTKASLFMSCSLALFLVGCGKTNPMLEQHPDFIGKWQSHHDTLVIEKNGQVEYRHKETEEKQTAHSDVEMSSKSDLKASITQFDQKQFQIGQGEFGQVFRIDRAPYQQNQHWQMQLNGQVYTKQ